MTVSVSDHFNDMPVEDALDNLPSVLEDGTYAAFYYDAESDVDVHGTLSIKNGTATFTA